MPDVYRNDFKKIATGINQNARSIVASTCRDIVTGLRMALLQPKSGRVYSLRGAQRRSRVQLGGTAHSTAPRGFSRSQYVASAPGESPAYRLGEYYAQLYVNLKDPLKGVVFTTFPWAPLLEGIPRPGKRIAPRPMWTVVVPSKAKQFFTSVQGAIR